MEKNDPDIVIHPFRAKKDPQLPEEGIFFVNPGEAGHAINCSLDQGGERFYLHNSNLVVTEGGDRFIAGPGVGAPVATLVVEKLIVLGAKRILLVGWCGAVDKNYCIGDLVVPDSAVSGEGTSRYYSMGESIAPHSGMVKRIQEWCDTLGLAHKSGCIWSTDAPYRESRKFLSTLNQEQNVVGVDMEFSALCSVASFRGVEFAAILLVSDEVWGERWTPGFKRTQFMENSRKVMELLLHNSI